MNLTVENFLVHLRLKFILFLVPIYLYGIVISDGTIFTWNFLIEFIILHVFIYGGVNALNDYYDRDEHGPIGGLENPPPVYGHSLFYLAWLWKLIGFYLSMKYSSSMKFVIGTFIGICMSVAYSHPKIRLKGDPFWSTLTVVALQGFLTYYFGTIVDTCNATSISAFKFWMGACVIMLTTLSTYPLSQVYQIEQDRLQGDQTLAIFLGVGKTFQFSCICLFLSGLIHSILLGYYYHWWEGVLIFVNSCALIYGVQQWKIKFEQQTVVENFKSLHRLLTWQTICSYLFCFGHLLNIL
ncbi:unnamed protein product [Adineta ricciae]|uniref:Prenyltransferase n=1 Tax=Adineta ricciae TaxID=249248 RepID=A0A815T4E7_ADIRI|nr:unnamed protein product [Adineta ricciae]CAF1524633.1 unnamed protein product [Adineta ricciae]